MTNAIDTALARIQTIVAAIGSVPFKAFPDYPVENQEPFPCSIAYIAGGRFWMQNAKQLYFAPSIAVEFHFQRVNLKKTYQQIDLVALEFAQRLAGDPTLGGAVDTIVADVNNSLPFTVRPFEWQTDAGVTRTISQMMLYEIPLKVLTAPTVTA